MAKEMVRICAWCQQINSEGMKEFAATVPEEIKKEMAVVDAQVKANRENFTFSHGACIPHTIQTYRTMPGMTPEKLKGITDKMENQPGGSPPCLVCDTPESQAVRHAYMKGLFTKELMQQALEKQQNANDEITERFQVLAGIRKFHA